MVQALEPVRRRADGGRVPPHNLEAEESLLGAMLLSRDAITAAVEVGVEASDFYKPAHTHLFEAILALYGQGEPVDPVTVAEELRRADLLDSLGGRTTLLRLQAATPASANATHYAKIVNELALLRRLIGVAGDIAEMGYDDSREVVETLDRAESLVFEVAERRVSESMIRVSDSASRPPSTSSRRSTTAPATSPASRLATPTWITCSSGSNHRTWWSSPLDPALERRASRLARRRTSRCRRAGRCCSSRWRWGHSS